MNRSIERRTFVIVAAACVVCIALAAAVACGQTESTSTNDAGDMADAFVPECHYTLVDGTPQTCPADGKTQCLATDGCNICFCLTDGGTDAHLSPCTRHPCIDP